MRLQERQQHRETAQNIFNAGLIISVIGAIATTTTLCLISKSHYNSSSNAHPSLAEQTNLMQNLGLGGLTLLAGILVSTLTAVATENCLNHRAGLSELRIRVLTPQLTTADSDSKTDNAAGHYTPPVINVV